MLARVNLSLYVKRSVGILNLTPNVLQDRDLMDFILVVVSRTHADIHCADARQKGFAPRPPLSLGVAKRMTATRRSFLKSGAITVLMAGMALEMIPSAFGQSNTHPDPTKDFPVPFEAQQSPLFYFKRETFEPYVGGTFKVKAGAKTVEMTLESVRDTTPTTQGCKITKKPARPSEGF